MTWTPSWQAWISGDKTYGRTRLTLLSHEHGSGVVPWRVWEPTHAVQFHAPSEASASKNRRFGRGTPYSSITPRVRAAFPGVVAAIRALRLQGYVLHTASGESLKDLDGYLQGMGVRECFDRLYGPDLLDTFKDGPGFYQRIFADAGVEPRNALVVDDNATAAGWAAQAGAQTVLISAAAPSSTNPTLCLGSLAELPALIERLH